MVRSSRNRREIPSTPVGVKVLHDSPFMSPSGLASSSNSSTPRDMLAGRKRGAAGRGKKRAAAWIMSPSSVGSPKASPMSKRKAQFATPKALAQGTPVGMRGSGTRTNTSTAKSSPFTMPHSPAAVLALRRTPHRSNPSSQPSSPIVDYTTANQTLPQLPQSQEQINQTFEEWIKIAADNKINANNTWNLALIDYFSELSLLKDGDSINFQKASCTLDGCIKIYTSRVDSVANETGKLLTGLSDNTKSRRRGDDGDDDEDEGRTSHRKRSKAASTIGTSASLNLKKFDLEFTVDPLFKKTSADFDEGGAKGLLLNHLGMNDMGKIVFDASDAAFTARMKENEIDDMSTPPSFVDLTRLRDKFLPDLDTLEKRQICSSLTSFSFFDDDVNSSLSNIDVETLMQRVADSMTAIEQEKGGNVVIDESLEDYLHDPTESANVGFENGPIDDGFGFSGGLDDDMSDHGGESDPMVMNMPTASMGSAGGSAQLQKTFIASMAEEKDALFSYFDAKLLRQWAGPEHWKMRPVFGGGKGSTATSQAKSSRKAEKAELDFLKMNPVDTETLFAKPSSAAIITLPKTVLAERSQQWHLLPEDLHMSSDTLLRLFMKPEGKTMVQRMQYIQGSQTDGTNHVDGADQIPFADGEAWMTQNNGFENGVFDQETSAATENTVLPQNDPIADSMDGDGFGFFGLDDDDDDDHMEVGDAMLPPPDGIPYVASSQPEADTMILPGGIELSLDFGNELVSAPRLTKSLKMTYAKRSKKCDVKKLKNTLWQNFQQRLHSPPASPSTGTKEGETPPLVTHFSELVESVMPHPQAPSDPTHAADATASPANATRPDALVKPSPHGLKDVSVPFCFICLLHLANENGLVLQGSDALDELSVAVDDQVQQVLGGAA